MGKKSTIDQLFVKVHNLLKKTKTPYILIGGLAAGVLGQPRFTQDADFLIFLDRNKLSGFLEIAKKEGLKFDKKKVERTILERGVFRLFLGNYHADFIINALNFGKSVLKRKIAIKFFNRLVAFPTPEDLILIKIIAGRELDLIDVKNIILRNAEKIDKKYLTQWAQKISDETENMRIWNDLNKILKESPK
ncbi:MAG: DUF6036 family nucleotidyltransferase [Elusimicrobiota bacterium]